MRPAFTKALYYPYIDIGNSDWLKTAILFWDSINTIVPESIEHPYDTPDSEYLADIGFLQPFHVSPTERSVVQIEDDVLSLMHTPDVLQALTMPRRSRSGHIYDSKMSYRVREQMLELMRGGVYAEKMSHRIADQLRHINHDFYENGIFHLDDSLANLYMTILANKICENESIALVTDDTTSQLLSNSARFDNQDPLIDNKQYRRGKDLRQGLLLDLIINGLRIAPDASLTEIVDFKLRHKDELGLFRTELAKLTQGVSSDIPVEALRQVINDLYVNEFLPAYNNFTRALSSSRIRCFTDTLLKVSLISTSATALPMALLGLPIQQALLASAGVSLIASAVTYNTEKKQKLRENPYSYLLATEREFM